MKAKSKRNWDQNSLFLYKGRFQEESSIGEC